MAAATIKRSRIRDEEDLYPSADGKPMAETDKHRDQGYYSIEALKVRYENQPNVYISGNNFIYYEEGNPSARISPDCYVIFGVPMQQRNSYMAWKEGGKLPDVVFEFTSKKTRKEDVHKKRPLYQDLWRVPEYFQFDPTGDYLKPRLQGFRLVNGIYVPLLPVNGRIYSEQLGLDLVEERESFRFYDPINGEFLESLLQTSRRARAEAQRAEIEAQRREEAEDEVARLRAEIEAMRRGNA